MPANGRMHREAESLRRELEEEMRYSGEEGLTGKTVLKLSIELDRALMTRACSEGELGSSSADQRE